MSKRKDQPTLDTFFVKKNKPDQEKENELSEAGPSTSDFNIRSVSHDIDSPTDYQVAAAPVHTVNEELDQPEAAKFEQIDVDIGEYVDQIHITDLEKVNILKNSFVPDHTFVYPYSLHVKNQKEKKCYLSLNHFKSFNWLVYSKSREGLFCKYCVLFAKKGGMHKNISLKSLVTVPLNKFSKLFGKDGDLLSHNSAKYHKNAVLTGENFLSTFNKPESEILNLIDRGRLVQVKENREKLKPIINSIIFLGKQGIAFRGHGTQSELFEVSKVNEGNLREIIRHRIQTCGDDLKLKSHFETATSRTKYLSPTIQNELIKCCGDEILNTILLKISVNKFYSIIFDETTDISKVSQMSILVRYLDRENNIREDFLGFIDCHKTNYDDFTKEPILTGEILGKTVVSFLNKIGLPFENCVGIGTDTCSVMLSDQKGAVSEIQKNLKNACKCPCYSHSLNLSISKSSTVQDIRNAVGTIKETIAFFNTSSKRSNVLKSTNPNVLESLCETRWTERHTAVLKFKVSFENIITTLQLITQWKDTESSSKAQRLMDAMLKTNFLVSLHCLSHVLNITVSLSKILQSKSLDKIAAQSLVNDIFSVFKKKREDVENVFKGIFEEVVEVHKKLDIPILLPRINTRQIHRNNIQTKIPEEYFRVSIFIPLLENIFQDLEFRFNSDLFKILDINNFIPTNVLKQSDIGLAPLVSNVAEYLSKFKNDSVDFFSDLLRAEIDLWINKWKEIKNETTVLPETALDTLHLCKKEIFPNIYTLLQIISIMPVSVASAERSFSTLKRLKTWLRSTIGQDRLVGLTLINIHKDIEINIDAVIDRFSKQRTRKVDFIL